jgi:hypothetical protein
MTNESDWFVISIKASINALDVLSVADPKVDRDLLGKKAS